MTSAGGARPLEDPFTGRWCQFLSRVRGPAHICMDPASLDALTDTLAQHWFGRGLEDLEAVV